jgi:hypothetical protein
MTTFGVKETNEILAKVAAALVAADSGSKNRTLPHPDGGRKTDCS